MQREQLIVATYSDLKDVESTDLKVRKALGEKVRDVCINVGFLYGTLQRIRRFPQMITPYWQ